jgi:AraC family chitin signaling transcriptional activator
MSARLYHVRNWIELAQQAKWSASALAKTSGVSVRTLERFFLNNIGKTPKVWLTEQRQEQAIKLLRDGASVKDVAARLGYRQASNFSRKFKIHWGSSPLVHTSRVWYNSVGKCRIMI